MFQEFDSLFSMVQVFNAEKKNEPKNKEKDTIGLKKSEKKQ